MIMLRNREPLVSIVVPVYNVERYIDKCLDSLFFAILRKYAIHFCK